MVNIPRFLSHLLFFYALMGEPIVADLLYRNLLINIIHQPKARINYYYAKLSIYWMWVAIAILIGITINLSEPVTWLAPLNDKGWMLTILVLITGGLLFFWGYHGKPSIPFHFPINSRVYLPNSRTDRLFYTATIVSGSISEELLYRGFTWFYLNMVFPQIPVWALVVISALIFAAGHYYQDKSVSREKGFKGIVLHWRGVAGTTLIGLLFGTMVAFCGSIIPSIFLHLVLDLIPIMTRPTAGAPLISPGHEQSQMSR